jgi:chromate reductase
MSRKIRIVGFTGNKRQNSYNKAVLQSAQNVLPAHAELEIITVDDLPVFVQTDTLPETVERFRVQLQQADAVLIATPEYKGLLPAGLQNALAWALHHEGENVLAEKPIALMGVGRQHGNAQQHLRQVLADQQVSVLAEPTVYVSAYDKFDQDGNLAHEETEQQISALLDALVAIADEKSSALVG